MTGRPTNWLAASVLEAANFVRQGRWEQADALLAQVLASHPGEPDALQLLWIYWSTPKAALPDIKDLQPVRPFVVLPVLLPHHAYTRNITDITVIRGVARSTLHFPLQL